MWSERWAKPASDVSDGAVAPSMMEGKILFDAYRERQTKFAAALAQHTERLYRREQGVIAIRVVFVLVVCVVVFLHNPVSAPLRSAIARWIAEGALTVGNVCVRVSLGLHRSR